MNMKLSISVSLFIFLSLVVSCSNEKSGGLIPKTRAVRLTLSSNNSYSAHKIEDALDGNYEQYLKLFNIADYQVGISSYKDGARTRVDKLAYYSGESLFNPATKSISQERPQIVSFINNIELNPKSVESFSLTKGMQIGLRDAFGTKAVFRMQTSFAAKTRADEEMLSNEDEFEMYIPHRIYILDPAATNDEENNPLCYYGDFVVRWNADEQNANGVLIYVEWLGGMAFGDDIDDTYVKRVSIFPDTGEAELDPCLFDGIPDSAICHLIIMRGAVENAQGEVYSYNLVAESHHMIPFILVREIEYL